MVVVLLSADLIFFFFNPTDYSHCDSVKREQTMNNASGCNTADDNVTVMTMGRGATATHTHSGGNGGAATTAAMMQFHAERETKPNKILNTL